MNTRDVQDLDSVGSAARGRNTDESDAGSCPDCAAPSRRRFLTSTCQSIVGAAALPALASVPLVTSSLKAAESPKAPAKAAETYVQKFYESLSPAQRKLMHFPFDHELRSYVANNWDVVEPKVAAIGELYTPDQKELLRQIFRSNTSEDGFERFHKQMEDDAGGFDNYTCAVFGKPGESKFEWVLTGRHLTMRVDGNSVENAAFGGPIFYGHAVTFNERPDHPGNVWWHQGKLANKVFEALDGKQREKALLSAKPTDDAATIALKGHGSEIPGLSGAELSSDPRGLLEETLKSLLGMFRASDVDEATTCIKENGGLEKLHLAYFNHEETDLGKDGVWDCWRVEGPTFAWHFRGAPHVHVWVNLAHRAGELDKRRL